MTTVTPARPLVTGGVDTHRDEHVAAALDPVSGLDPVGGLLGTAIFPTMTSGYAALRSFGGLASVGVEGTGSCGAALHLSARGVHVLEASRPNRQVRRRYGKSDVVDAIAAARAIMSGEATGTPKTHGGPAEALRALKSLQRSATKARTQALNQLRAVLVTAPDELRARLSDLPRGELLATCAAFRIAARDDSRQHHPPHAA